MSENATPRTEALLRDALDHIKRVAYEGIQPTRRLDWIALRAKVALRGDIWEPGMRDEPDNSRAELIEKNMKLREKLSADNARIAELEKDAARYRWLRLAGDVSWAIRRDMPGDGLVDLYCDAPPYILCEQESIDAAIDAAMSAKEKP